MDLWPRFERVAAMDHPNVRLGFSGSFCARLHQLLLGLPSPLKVDSTDRTHILGSSRVATNGSGVVGKIAKAARVMCLRVLHFFTWMLETVWSNVFEENVDESCGFGTAGDESGGSVHRCQKSWMLVM